MTDDWMKIFAVILLIPFALIGLSLLMGKMLDRTLPRWVMAAGNGYMYGYFSHWVVCALLNYFFHFERFSQIGGDLYTKSLIPAVLAGILLNVLIDRVRSNREQKETPSVETAS